MKGFVDIGFVVLRGAFPGVQASNLREKIKQQLNANAKELDVNLDNYLYCTGRWASPSKVVACVDKQFYNIIQEKLENLLGKKIKMGKSNIICKNRNIKDAVSLHQDISYSPASPYHLSFWLALNDIDERAGPLQFIKGSHKWPVLPAVDFWSPQVDVNAQFEQKHKNSLEIITLKAGDAVVFDSRLWHGSIKSISGEDRYAYVTRWEILQQTFPEIPQYKPAHFGMWNCRQMTEEILAKGLFTFSHVANDNFVDLLTMWQNVLETTPNIFEGINIDKAVRDLNNVKILNIAAERHNAGDLTGRIYKSLWYSLLEPIGKRIGL